MPRDYRLTEDEALTLHKLVDSQCKAFKNWIASAVEGGRFEYAQELVEGLRVHEALYKKLNVVAHRELDAEATHIGLLTEK